MEYSQHSQFTEMFGNTQSVTLGDHFQTQSGGTPNTKIDAYYIDGTIPWLTSGEIHQGYIFRTEKFITEQGLLNSSAKWIPAESIVIAMYGATAGKVGLVKHPMTTNQAVCTLIPSEKFNSLFLYYAILEKHDWMISQCQGAAQPNISQGIIRTMEIPYPDISLQNQFAEIVRQADKSKFDGFKSQFMEMTKTCKEEVILSSIAKYYIGLTYAPSDVSEHGIIVLRSGNIQDGNLNFDDIVRVNKPIKPSLLVKDGDIIMCSRNGSASLVGKTAIIKDSEESMSFGAFMTVIRTESPEYVNAFFQTQQFREQISMGKSSTMNQITQKMLDGVKLPYISLSLQNQFADIVRQADKSKFDGFKSQFLEWFGNPVTNTKKWNTSRIQDIAPESPACHIDNENVWILNLDMVESHTGKLIGKVVCPKDSLNSASPFDNGNVLFSKLRPYLNKVYMPNESGYATTEFVPLRPNNEFLNRTFFCHLLRSDAFVSYANEISGGTKMPRMPLKELREFDCIIPPLSLQNQFAEIVRQADKSKYYENNKIKNICHILMNPIPLRKCS